MKRNWMLPRVVAGAVRHRLMRVAIAALSVAVGASLVAALASVSLDVGSKAGKELRSYGPNLVLTPKAASGRVGVGSLDFGTVQEERYLEESRLIQLDRESSAGLLGYSPYLVGSATANGVGFALVGTDFERVRAMRPWWSVTGRWAGGPENSDEPTSVMMGVDLARTLGVQAGSTLDIGHGAERLPVTVAGIVETGGDEDRQLFAPLPTTQRLLDKQGLLSTVDLSVVAGKRSLQDSAREIERLMPESRVRVVGQIADAEASTLGKVQSLMGLVTVIVLLASGLAVASTMAASVMERTREIGLMKALGAGSKQVAAVFLAEAAVIALLGGLPGYLLGLGVTQAIGQIVFGTAISPSPVAIPLTGAVALLTCLTASVLPVRRALSVDPALTLRGE